MKHTSILLFLLCMSLVSAAQPAFSAHYVPGAGLESISATILRDSGEWLIYTTSGKLYRTTNGGGAYTLITTFTAGTNIRKFVAIGDTVIGVGSGIVRSTDFGQTWANRPVASGGEIYDDILVMPGGKLWLSGCKNASNNLWETNTAVAGYTLKFSIPTPLGIPLTDRLTNISTFSTDSVFLITRDTAAVDYGVHYTYNAGASWGYRRLHMDSLYKAMGDTASALTGTYRVSYVKYHNGRRANIFTVSSHFTKDFVTTNSFSNLGIDTPSTAHHDAHQVIDWISCDGHEYIAFDHNEDSNPGLQQVSLNSKGEVLLGSYFPGQTVHLSHVGDFAVAGTVDMLVTKIAGICSPSAQAPSTRVRQGTAVIAPNPSDGIFRVSYTGSNAWTWEVCDMTGRTVATGDSREPQIDLAGSVRGTYVVRISDGSSSSIHRIVRY